MRKKNLLLITTLSMSLVSLETFAAGDEDMFNTPPRAVANEEDRTPPRIQRAHQTAPRRENVGIVARRLFEPVVDEGPVVFPSNWLFGGDYQAPQTPSAPAR